MKVRPSMADPGLQNEHVDIQSVCSGLNHEAVQLMRELQHLFKLEAFTLWEWKYSQGDILASFPTDLKDPKARQEICYQDELVHQGSRCGMEHGVELLQSCDLLIEWNKLLTKGVLCQTLLACSTSWCGTLMKCLGRSKKWTNHPTNLFRPKLFCTSQIWTV